VDGKRIVAGGSNERDFFPVCIQHPRIRPSPDKARSRKSSLVKGRRNACAPLTVAVGGDNCEKETANDAFKVMRAKGTLSGPQFVQEKMPPRKGKERERLSSFTHALARQPGKDTPDDDVGGDFQEFFLWKCLFKYGERLQQ